MSRLRIQRHAVDILFTLALFCVLAASSLLVVVIGVRAYESITASMASNYTSRTTLSYISTKVRQNGEAGSVRLDTFGDGQALVLEQSISGTLYRTWIYQSDGQIRELFARADNEISPEEGQPIMESPGLQMEQVGESLLRFSVEDGQGGKNTVLVSLR